MEKKYKFKVGLDVDDVLLPCMALAVEWANKEYEMDPPLSIEEITQWDRSGKRSDVIFKYFDDPNFFETQTPLEGAQEFVRKLSKKAEVFAVTAIRPDFTGIRAKQIQKFFPEIPLQNLIPAYRKDVVQMDFVLDDGAHNILASNAKYPVLLRRSWNTSITGVLAVNGYDEFLNLFDSVIQGYIPQNYYFNTTPVVVALVGPSGSGKTAIANELIKYDKFGTPISATTRRIRSGEAEDAYHFMSNEKFEELKKSGKLAEFTTYAGNQYGVEVSSINKVLKSGQHCVLPIDISGAMALKMQYRTIIVYIKRNRKDLTSALIQRVLDGETSKEDIVSRILSLDDEKRNEEVSDYVVVNDGTLLESVEGILKTMNVK